VKLFLVGILLLFITACTPKLSNNDFSEDNHSIDSTINSTNSYESNISNFEKITVNNFNELKESKNDNNVYVYFGRKTCKYCVSFVKELKVKSENKNIKVKYIDTVNFSDELLEQLDIEYVPSLKKIHKGKVSTYNYFDDLLENFLT